MVPILQIADLEWTRRGSDTNKVCLYLFCSKYKILHRPHSSKVFKIFTSYTYVCSKSIHAKMSFCERKKGEHANNSCFLSLKQWFTQVNGSLSSRLLQWQQETSSHANVGCLNKLLEGIVTYPHVWLNLIVIPACTLSICPKNRWL